MGQRWWGRSILPYLVLLISPVLTLPASATILATMPDCGVDEPWWELRNFEIALVPALADLLPFLWLVSALIVAVILLRARSPVGRPD